MTLVIIYSIQMVISGKHMRRIAPVQMRAKREHDEDKDKMPGCLHCQFSKVCLQTDRDIPHYIAAAAPLIHSGPMQAGCARCHASPLVTRPAVRWDPARGHQQKVRARTRYHPVSSYGAVRLYGTPSTDDKRETSHADTLGASLHASLRRTRPNKSLCRHNHCIDLEPHWSHSGSLPHPRMPVKNRRSTFRTRDLNVCLNRRISLLPRRFTPPRSSSLTP